MWNTMNAYTMNAHIDTTWPSNLASNIKNKSRIWIIAGFWKACNYVVYLVGPAVWTESESALGLVSLIVVCAALQDKSYAKVV